MKERLTGLWSDFTGWACWKAWTWARKREMARSPGAEIEPIPQESEQSPGRRRSIGNEARQVLENRHYREAFQAVSHYLDEQALGCDPDHKDKAARIVISKQLLATIRREFERKINDGYMAEVEMEEIERAKKPRRFAR